MYKHNLVNVEYEKDQTLYCHDEVTFETKYVSDGKEFFEFLYDFSNMRDSNLGHIEVGKITSIH